MKKYNIKLNTKEIYMVCNAIGEVGEYTTQWDNLAGRIIEQAKKQGRKS
jgi:hypothetical protein